jgi:hypothetical protein
MCGLKRGVIMRSGVSLLLSCCVLLPLSGCIFLPLPEHDLWWGKGRIDDNMTESVKEGVTTREDILLRFGEPEAVMRNGNVFIYSWGVTSGIVGFMYSGGVIHAHHSVAFEFSPDNRILRMQKHEKWGQGIGSAFAKLFSTYETGQNGLVVVLEPLPNIWTRSSTPSKISIPRSISVGEFRDEREEPYTGTRLGRHWNGMLFKETEIHAYRPISEIVRACITNQLEKSGYSVVEQDGTIAVDGYVTIFDAEVTTVELDITVRLRSSSDSSHLTRRFRISSRDWSALSTNPFKSDVSMGYLTFSLDRTLRSALEDFQDQLASDLEVKRFLTRN